MNDNYEIVRCDVCPMPQVSTHADLDEARAERDELEEKHPDKRFAINYLPSSA